MAWHTECSVQAGLHAFFRMSRQISPVWGRAGRGGAACGHGLSMGWAGRAAPRQAGRQPGRAQAAAPASNAAPHLPVDVGVKDFGAELDCTAGRSRHMAQQVTSRAGHCLCHIARHHPQSGHCTCPGPLPIPAGATSGYCSGTDRASSNRPPSYGVSLGPCGWHAGRQAGRKRQVSGGSARCRPAPALQGAAAPASRARRVP